MAENPKQESPSQPGSSLNEKGLVLERILPKVIAECQPEISTAADLVVALVAPDKIIETCEALKNEPSTSFDCLMCLCVVDYVDHLQVVYHLYSTSLKHMVVVKVNIPTDIPNLPSVTSIWRGANWYERESHDLFGVVFDGHPALEPLLLYEGFEGYPGRKDYPMPEYREW